MLLLVAALLMGVGLAVVVSVEKNLEDIAMAKVEGKAYLAGMGLTFVGLFLGLYAVLNGGS